MKHDMHPMDSISQQQASESARVAEHRRRRLMELVAHLDLTDTAFAAETGISSGNASYVSRLFYEEGKKGKKSIGDKTCRLIEKRYNLSRAWLDLPLGSELPMIAAPESAREQLGDAVAAKNAWRALELGQIYLRMPSQEQRDALYRLVHQVKDGNNWPVGFVVSDAPPAASSAQAPAASTPAPRRGPRPRHQRHP